MCVRKRDYIEFLYFHDFIVSIENKSKENYIGGDEENTLFGLFTSGYANPPPSYVP